MHLVLVLVCADFLLTLCLLLAGFLILCFVFVCALPCVSLFAWLQSECDQRRTTGWSELLVLLTSNCCCFFASQLVWQPISQWVRLLCCLDKQPGNLETDRATAQTLFMSNSQSEMKSACWQPVSQPIREQGFRLISQRLSVYRTTHLLTLELHLLPVSWKSSHNKSSCSNAEYSTTKALRLFTQELCKSDFRTRHTAAKK